jgi:hypothetical protein
VIWSNKQFGFQRVFGPQKKRGCIGKLQTTILATSKSLSADFTTKLISFSCTVTVRFDLYFWGQSPGLYWSGTHKDAWIQQSHGSWSGHGKTELKTPFFNRKK